MKANLITGMIAVLLTAFVGLVQAQQGSHSGMAGDADGARMMGPRMMHQETMQHMNQMMHQMQEMMGDVTRKMDQTQQRLQDQSGDGEPDRLREQDQAQLRDMAEVMDRLGTNLQQMARHMNRGELDEPARERIRNNIEEMRQLMDGME